MRVFILPNPVNEHLTFLETIERAKSVSLVLGGGEKTDLHVEDVTFQRGYIEMLDDAGFRVTAVPTHGQDKRARLALASHMIQAGKVESDYCLVLGLRNSHDKTFPAGVVAGASVFVCDNLSFSGEVKFARKHTRFIVRDLPMLVQSGIGHLTEKWHAQTVRFEAYKEKRIDDVGAHDILIRAADVGVVSNRLIPAVLKEWREPKCRTSLNISRDVVQFLVNGHRMTPLSE